LAFQGQLFELNDIAAEVWNALDGTRRLRSILEDLAPSYDVDQEQLFDDVLAWTHEMIAMGLIQARQEG
jgi:monoamine oxidase